MSEVRQTATGLGARGLGLGAWGGASPPSRPPPLWGGGERRAWVAGRLVGCRVCNPLGIGAISRVLPSTTTNPWGLGLGGRGGTGGASPPSRPPPLSCISQKPRQRGRLPAPGSLPSEEGTSLHVVRTFTWEPRPETGLDCLVCAIFGGRGGTGGASPPSRPPPLSPAPPLLRKKYF